MGCVCGFHCHWEQITSCDHLWDEFIQGDTQRGYVQGISYHNKEDEENLALTTNGNNKNSKKDSKGGTKKQVDQKKDMRKLNSFSFHKFGHYDGHCLNKKNKKHQETTSMDIDEYTTWFERYFSLCCLF